MRLLLTRGLRTDPARRAGQALCGWLAAACGRRHRRAAQHRHGLAAIQLRAASRRQPSG
ncbi:hypothetical protein GRF63_12860 [Erythrobacter sp. GH3-10]|uniref:Uncharacterized protein n=1 Tax=Aurantiacibacter rhizosphaerae TaxID=2691582 RepID=A0A844XGV1_9SPHN|nr:hypothetical protein [Aurantiacibacter rhizosphaerae]